MRKMSNVSGTVTDPMHIPVRICVFRDAPTKPCTHLCRCRGQQPLYTLSRKSRIDSTGVKATGVGWSEAGINRFNDLYECVLEDRLSRGIVFNNELLNVVLERRRVKQAQKTRIPDTLKRKTMAKDDLEITNGEPYSLHRDTDGVHV